MLCAEKLTEKIYELRPRLVDLGPFPVPDPDFGDLSLQLHPLNRTLLPIAFMRWQPCIPKMLEHVPYHYECRRKNPCFATISSKFFSTASALRREGIHIDGNFCADPEFSKSTWGGTTTTWGGVSTEDGVTITTPWACPYGSTPPLGQYMSSTLGGALVAASYAGCEVWPNAVDCRIGDAGDLQHMEGQLGESVMLEAHRLYFMTSDTPHQSLIVPKGTRRTLLRITLPHDYRNAGIRNADVIRPF